MLEPHSSFVETESIRLHYLEWSFPTEHISSLSSIYTSADVHRTNSADTTDEIPVVLLHGLGATAHFWQLVAQELGEHHRIVAFDIRGHGESEKPSADYELTTISEDVIAAMAMLGMGQVILIAHGWGARVALVLAARHPALVSHLVLVDCPHIEPRYWPGMTRERFLREQENEASYPSRETFLAARRQEMSLFWSPEIEHILLTTVEELPDGRVIERLGTEQQRLIRASLWEDRALTYYSKLTCPVLLVPAAPEPGRELPEQLLHTDDFALLKGHMAQQVAAIIPHCSILWMPDTAHDIQLQRPAMLARAMLQFIEQ